MGLKSSTIVELKAIIDLFIEMFMLYNDLSSGRTGFENPEHMEAQLAQLNDEQFMPLYSNDDEGAVTYLKYAVQMLKSSQALAETSLSRAKHFEILAERFVMLHQRLHTVVEKALEELKG
jgi:hypothetical protein